MFRCVVKFGHYADFIATIKASKEAAVRLGLPVYRLYEKQVMGIRNELFAEADHEAAVWQGHSALEEDPEYAAALTLGLSHLVDGELCDYLLSEVPLDHGCAP
jgi:hypothetical protein